MQDVSGYPCHEVENDVKSNLMLSVLFHNNTIYVLSVVCSFKVIMKS